MLFVADLEALSHARLVGGLAKAKFPQLAKIVASLHELQLQPSVALTTTNHTADFFQ